jgi:RecB family exonuclease
VALLAGNGYAWDDVVVASANAATDGELLLAAFARAGIPARLQARRGAIDVPAGRALHELLDALVLGDALRLVAALRSPIFGLPPALVDRTEVRLRGDRHTPGDLLHARALRRMLPAEVAALADLRRGGDAAVPAMRALLGSLLPGDLGELDLLRGIAALLEGLVIAAGSERHVALVDIRDAVAAFPLTTPDRSDSGTVVIASLDDLRSVAFDAVVLRGMHLSGFRARVDDDAEAPAAGRDLLHLAVTRARRTLRVVRQAAGADGGHLAPSPAWQELRRLQPDAPVRTRRLGDVVVAPDDVRLVSERASAYAMASGLGRTVTGVPDELQAAVASQRRVVRAPLLDGPIADELAAVRQLSVTAIERYAVCSAKWYIEQQLKVGDPDDDRSRIAEGILAHALLQRLVPDARMQPTEPATLRERAMALAPDVAAELDTRGVLDPARIERITEHVLALIAAEEHWLRPDSIDVERSFGRDAPDSIGPGLDVDGVEVVGRIDRMDQHGSYVLLHDYKYGSTDRPARTLIKDRNLQLLVYWLALQQPGSPVEPIGALYRAVTKGGTPSGVFSPRLREVGVISARQKAGVLDGPERDELLEEATQVVQGAVAGIRSGIVSPLPDPSLCPSHCQLQVICRVGEQVGA